MGKDVKTSQGSSNSVSRFGDTLQQFSYASPSTLTSGMKHPNPLARCSPNLKPKSPTTKALTAASSLSSSLKRKAAAFGPTPSATPPKKKRSSSSYAPPSKYAHLTNHLTDSLAFNLICVFIGVNPGLRTATAGHAYAHPSNLFWKLAHSSGCTPRLCKPQEDQDLPHLYALGHTNIVTRPTKDASELSAQEMDEGVEVLEEKTRRWRPESVCIVGKGIWESIWRVKHGRKIAKSEFRYGWQDEEENMGAVEGEWKGARVFVATTTSGLAAGMRPFEKEEVWKGLGEWIVRRRMERGIPDKGGVKIEEESIKLEDQVVKEEVVEGG